MFIERVDQRQELTEDPVQLWAKKKNLECEKMKLKVVIKSQKILFKETD